MKIGGTEGESNQRLLNAHLCCSKAGSQAWPANLELCTYTLQAGRSLEPRVFTTDVRTAECGAGATIGPYKVPFGALAIGRVGGPARGEDVMAREWRRGSPHPSCPPGPVALGTKIASSPQVSFARSDPAPHPSKTLSAPLRPQESKASF